MQEVSLYARFTRGRASEVSLAETAFLCSELLLDMLCSEANARVETSAAAQAIALASFICFSFTDEREKIGFLPAETLS